MKRLFRPSRMLHEILAPLVALATTVVMSVLGVQGALTGSHALHATLQAAQSTRELETIAAGLQNINGHLYHVLTLRGADARKADLHADMHDLLAECDQVSHLLGAWRDARSSTTQRAQVDILIADLGRYRDAVSFVSQMLDVDFVAAVSFVRPFDRNFAELAQSVQRLVHEVGTRQHEDADLAMRRASAAIWAFAIVGAVAVLLALLAAARLAWATVHASRLSRQNRVLEQMTQIDALTGLANRRCFDDKLADALRRATATQEPLSLVMLDIDHFKKFNDSQGHQAGDTCLKRVAAALSQCLREDGDIVARYGGEEFAIILPNRALDSARAVAERVRQAVLYTAIAHPAAGPPGIVTMSLGVASLIPNAAVSPSSMIEAADRALYAAKRTGRNRVADTAALVAESV